MSMMLLRDQTQPVFRVETIRKFGIRYLVVGEQDFSTHTPDLMMAMKKEIQSVLVNGKDGVSFKRVFATSRGNYEIYETIREKP